MMWSYSYRGHVNKTTFKKGSLENPMTMHKTGIWHWFVHTFLWSEPKACACKHRKKHFITLTVYSLLKLDPESINVAILIAWPVLGHRLKRSIPLKFKWCLKATFNTVYVTSKAFVCVQILMYDHQTILYLPSEIVKNYIFFREMF